MANFQAAYPHDAGLFSAEYADVKGDTRAKVLAEARHKCPVGGRYLSSINHVDSGDTVWRESGGWTEQAEKHLPS